MNKRCNHEFCHLIIKQKNWYLQQRFQEVHVQCIYYEIFEMYRHEKLIFQKYSFKTPTSKHNTVVEISLNLIR